MGRIAESELIINGDGSIFHLHIGPEDLADTVMLVGDPGRVDMVASFFDEIEVEYKCTCSRERMKKALLSIKENEIYDMLREQVEEGKPEELDIFCRFCNTHYTFTKAEIDKAFGK